MDPSILDRRPHVHVAENRTEEVACIAASCLGTASCQARPGDGFLEPLLPPRGGRDQLKPGLLPCMESNSRLVVLVRGSMASG